MAEDGRPSPTKMELKNELINLREKNSEMAVETQNLKITLAQRDKEKLELNKENNLLRLRLGSLRNKVLSMASEWDKQMDDEAKEAVENLVQASNHMSRSIELRKMFMKNFGELDTVPWHFNGASPSRFNGGNPNRVVRIPPQRFMGQCIQPVVTLFRDLQTVHTKLTVPLARLDLANMFQNNLDDQDNDELHDNDNEEDISMTDENASNHDAIIEESNHDIMDESNHDVIDESNHDVMDESNHDVMDESNHDVTDEPNSSESNLSDSELNESSGRLEPVMEEGTLTPRMLSPCLNLYTSPEPPTDYPIQAMLDEPGGQQEDVQTQDMELEPDSPAGLIIHEVEAKMEHASLSPVMALPIRIANYNAVASRAQVTATVTQATVTVTQVASTVTRDAATVTQDAATVTQADSTVTQAAVAVTQNTATVTQALAAEASRHECERERDTPPRAFTPTVRRRRRQVAVRGHHAHTPGAIPLVVISFKERLLASPMRSPKSLQKLSLPISERRSSIEPMPSTSGEWREEQPSMSPYFSAAVETSTDISPPETPLRGFQKSVPDEVVKSLIHVPSESGDNGPKLRRSGRRKSVTPGHFLCCRDEETTRKIQDNDTSEHNNNTRQDNENSGPVRKVKQHRKRSTSLYDSERQKVQEIDDELSPVRVTNRDHTSHLNYRDENDTNVNTRQDNENSGPVRKVKQHRKRSTSLYYSERQKVQEIDDELSPVRVTNRDHTSHLNYRDENDTNVNTRQDNDNSSPVITTHSYKAHVNDCEQEIDTRQSGTSCIAIQRKILSISLEREGELSPLPRIYTAPHNDIHQKDETNENVENQTNVHVHGNRAIKRRLSVFQPRHVKKTNGSKSSNIQENVGSDYRQTKIQSESSEDEPLVHIQNRNNVNVKRSESSNSQDNDADGNNETNGSKVAKKLASRRNTVREKDDGRYRSVSRQGQAEASTRSVSCRDSDSDASTMSDMEDARPRRNLKKPVTYKQIPLNRKMRR